MASVVGICNRALQLLGATRISTIDDDSKTARACKAAYEPVRDSEIRSHPWSFAIARAALAADAETPEWGRAYSFTQPSDCLAVLNPYPESNSQSHDWEIEGRKILTNDAGPLYVRYLKKITDPNEMDALFREALAHKLADAICEELTQSNTKKASLENGYELIIRRAKKANAIERVSAQPPEDYWVDVRY